MIEKIIAYSIRNRFLVMTAAAGLTIWAIYAAKHWDAIMQYCSDFNVGIDRPRMEPLSSRCDDLIVYLILFKAMLIEREREQ